MPTASSQPPHQDLRPKRSLGQHFLKDVAYLEQMLDAAEIEAGDRVLEIGPGKGALTHALAERGAQVTAVELDPRMADYLSDRFADRPQVRVVEGDILEMQPDVLMAEYDEADLAAGANRYKVAANLPYYITSAILRQILEARNSPEIAAVMVQKEVAERICAQPDDMSLLAVSVQFYARPKMVTVVPAGAFYPKPKVDSAILRLDVRAELAVTDVPAKRYFSVVRAGFAQRRKQVANSLSAGLGLQKNRVRDALAECGIDPRRRAETFTLDEWRTVCLALGWT